MNCKNDGFTLLELLVSITILSVTLLIILGGFRLSVRAWEKGEKGRDESLRTRLVSDMIRQQFGSIFTQNILNEGKLPYYLKGDEKSLEFLSIMSLTPWNSNELRFVKYSILEGEHDNNERLCFYEKRYFEITRYFDPEKIDEDEFYELISEKQNISFNYLKKNKKSGGFEWVATWLENDINAFPAAVRIIVQAEGDNEAETMIFPIVDHSL